MLTRDLAPVAVVAIVFVVAAWGRLRGAEWSTIGVRCALACSVLLVLVVTMDPIPIDARFWKPWHFRAAQLVPLHTITDQIRDGGRDLAQAVGNVLVFVPFGATLPFALRRARRPLVTVAAGALLSIAIEVAQTFVPTHTPDVDDVILNTVGTALGYGAYATIARIRPRAVPGDPPSATRP